VPPNDPPQTRLEIVFDPKFGDAHGVRATIDHGNETFESRESPRYFAILQASQRCQRRSFGKAQKQARICLTDLFG
jgi:hypothetical protein